MLSSHPAHISDDTDRELLVSCMKKAGHIITLLTDFGLQDWFVGTMKGVIAGIAPEARIIDLTHGIPAGDIAAGAMALRASYRFFPAGTIHLAVVDPGVGSSRPALAVQTDDYLFVGPDNGVLSWALAGLLTRRVHRLERSEFWLPQVSGTFHGRDIFAPVAARLALGMPVTEFGPECKNYARLPWPAPRRMPGGWVGQVLYFDHFGNALTNLTPDLVGPEDEIKVGRHKLGRMVACYTARPAGEPLALIGSAGLIEIAVNQGSARNQLRLNPGDPVTCHSPG